MRRLTLTLRLKGPNLRPPWMNDAPSSMMLHLEEPLQTNVTHNCHPKVNWTRPKQSSLKHKYEYPRLIAQGQW